MPPTTPPAIAPEGVPESGLGVAETCCWPDAPVGALVDEELEDLVEEEVEDDEEEAAALGMELGFVDVTFPSTIHLASGVPQQVVLDPPQHQLLSGH